MTPGPLGPALPHWYGVVVWVKWTLCGALCLGACTFEIESSAQPDGDTDPETSGGEAGTMTGPPPSGSTSSGASGETSPSTTATSDPTTSPTSEDTTDETATTAGETGSETSDETGTAEYGCPDPLPESWVLCEDFEDVGNFADHFADVDGSGLTIGGPGYESPDALQITHFAQQSWVGEVLFRFGQGPAANNVASPNARFEELWVRARFRADEGWPVQGPGDLLSLDGVLADGGWGATFKARLSAGQFEPAIRNSAFTCVYGNDIPCDGNNDWDFLSYLGGEPGDVAVFEESVVSDWHCAVIHARLNTPGNANGLLEVSVDGQSDAATGGLDFRGSQSSLAFNVLSIPTFMQTPLQNDHRRYIDDVVVSTQALDCE